MRITIRARALPLNQRPDTFVQSCPACRDISHLAKRGSPYIVVMFQKAMDSERFQKVWELERAGKLEEGLRLLKALANENDPLALIELGSRHITTDGYAPPVLSVGSDPDKGKELIEKGRRVFEEMAAKGDGEAMRMLGYYYLGHLCPCEKNIQKAEAQLLNALQAGCYFAANDLHTFYLGTNIEKSKHYYKEAESHKCRVVFYEDFET